MDFLTHALSGASMAYALPRSIRSRSLPLYAAFISLIPDADILFTSTPTEFLLWHRGPTHSFIGAILMTFVLAFILRRFFGNTSSQQQGLRNPIAEYQWSFLEAWLFIIALILMHIWLDVSNNYGTQIFWPILDTRARLNSVFIIDLLLILSLTLCLVRYRQSRVAMLFLCIWVFMYPLINLGIRLVAEKHLTTIYSQHPDIKDRMRSVSLIPDAFTPIRWSIVLDTDDARLGGAYTLFSTPPEQLTEYKKPDPALWKALDDASEMFRVYDLFACLPIQHPTRIATDGSGLQEISFSDMRFISNVPFVRNLAKKILSDNETVFSFTARVDADKRIIGTRLILPKGSGGDSGWLP